ncbi:MAG: aminotransferase class I/II-fold pyridoxal phosphate-dependent enzyme, partial [Rhizobiales bacterium]|nr:aminotransferase class I/II-fold pyridoxal phosphate-dependent enzyme [Hyphomicrobiales bacterium]
AKHVVSCASGTDALIMVLMAKGIGPGDAILCPSFTFCATGESVALTGASPVFVDVDPITFNMDTASLKRGLVTARNAGLKPKGIIVVDLFGQAADHDAVAAVAEAEGLFVLDDAAQSFGATYKGRRLGGIGNIMTTSFFPAKPLGCYGDGGAIFTDDAALADILRSIRVHGQGSDKYDNVRLGLTARLDTIQAAVLLQKLTIFEDEIVARNEVAERYAATRALLEASPSSFHPVTRKIIEGARGLTAVSVFEATYKLMDLKRAVAPLLARLDCLAVPTVPRAYTVAELAADPITLNSNLGSYTNFVNLLDLAALSVPTADRADGLRGSLTLIGRAGSDGYLAGIGMALTGEATSAPIRAPADRIEIAVVGAHLSGLPLNGELTGLGGNFLRAIPEQEQVTAAWSQLRLTVQIATKLNRSHLFNGEVAYLLPCLGRIERVLENGQAQVLSTEDSTSCIHASVGKAEPASPELKSETRIVVELARRTLTTNPKVPWEAWANDYATIRDAIEQTYPEQFQGFNQRMWQPGGFHRPNSARERVWKTDT